MRLRFLANKKGIKSMWRSMLVLSLALFHAWAWAGAAEFDKSVLKKSFDAMSPAIGILRYTIEMTNPNSGEKSRSDRLGLALVVSADGLAMAQGHVKLDNTRPFNMTITLGEGEDEKRYDATLLNKPKDLNVAFLRITSDEALDLPHVKFAKEERLELGSPVALVGILGDSMDYARTIQETRVGTVLAKPRKTYCLQRPVRLGYIAGPVLDVQGNAVGVLGFDLSRGEGGDLYTRSGQPLIYQASLFQKYIDNPDFEEEDAPAYLGVFTQPLTNDFAEYWGLEPNGGLIVSTVVQDSPAEAAGILAGDVIVDFDGTPIRAKLDRAVMDFSRLVRATGSIREVTITLMRDGAPISINTMLGDRPKERVDAEEYEDEFFGLTVREITANDRISLNLARDVQGVIVGRVRSGSIAQLGRLRPGVIILSFGNQPVKDIDAFKAAVKAVAEARPDEVVVFARVGAGTGFFRLEPRWPEGEE